MALWEGSAQLLLFSKMTTLLTRVKQLEFHKSEEILHKRMKRVIIIGTASPGRGLRED